MIAVLLVMAGAGPAQGAQSQTPPVQAGAGNASSSPEPGKTRASSASGTLLELADDGLLAGHALTVTLTGSELEQLPLTGRDWRDLVLDAPPAATADRRDGSAAARGEPAAITVDGADIRLAFGTARLGGARIHGATLMGPAAGETAIRRVQTAAGDAGIPYGSALGPRVRVRTVGGTSALHGRISLIVRQWLLSALNPFSQWVRQTAPATATTVPVFTAQPYTSDDKETLWSGGLGGPIRRGKLFWYASLSNRRRDHPGVSTVRHPDHFFAQPSNDEMQVLSARLGLSSVNPVVEGLAAYSGMLQTLAGLLGPETRTVSRWTGFGRVDWQPSARYRVMVEGTGASRDAPGAGMARASEMYGTHSYGSHRSSEQWVLGRWEAFVTPRLLAVTQASGARHIMQAPPQTPSAYEQTLNVNAWGQLPQIAIDTRYGFTIGKQARFGTGSYPDERMLQVQQQVDWVHGGLLLRAGFDLRHNRDAATLLRNQTGTYSYSSVENFVSDALAFADFGLSGQLDPFDQHNCDQTGKVWRDRNGTLHGLGYLPCYSYYTQTIGPADWRLSTNDWGGYVAGRWQPRKRLELSMALRWDREQLPQAIAALRNPDLPLTERLPGLGDEWGPRISLAWSPRGGDGPVLRLGYGLYYGRTANSTVLHALTQTGSPSGDLRYFMRPTDNLYGGGAPPFPYVLAGAPATVIKPDAVEFGPSFRNAEVHQAVGTVEQRLPLQLRVTASGVLSLGRRLPVVFDANIDPAVNPQTITYVVVDGNGTGPIKTPTITVPFYALWPSNTSPTGFSGRLNPNYQQISELESRANSTYEAAVVRLVRYGRRGLNLRVRYAYAHAMDWNPGRNAGLGGPTVFDPEDLRQEYGASDLDVRHSLSTALIWAPRW